MTEAGSTSERRRVDLLADRINPEDIARFLPGWEVEETFYRETDVHEGWVFSSDSLAGSVRLEIDESTHTVQISVEINTDPAAWASVRTSFSEIELDEAQDSTSFISGGQKVYKISDRGQSHSANSATCDFRV